MIEGGDLVVTKRGELRLLGPRTPGTGALFFCRYPAGAWRRPDVSMADPPGNPYNTATGKAPCRRLGYGETLAMRVIGPPSMNDDIPFDKSFGLAPDQVREVAPGVRAIAADNPGPFTFKGTISYIVGRDQVAIIDPGPDDDAHVAALLEAVRGE